MYSSRHQPKKHHAMCTCVNRSFDFPKQKKKMVTDHMIYGLSDSVYGPMQFWVENPVSEIMGIPFFFICPFKTLHVQSVDEITMRSAFQMSRFFLCMFLLLHSGPPRWEVRPNCFRVIKWSWRRLIDLLNDGWLNSGY